jgi:hypothetical protein
LIAVLPKVRSASSKVREIFEGNLEITALWAGFDATRDV